MSERGTWYFTFGVGQPNAGSYFVVENATNAEARAEMFKRFGRTWAFDYDEADWHRHGISQAEKYGYVLLERVRVDPVALLEARVDLLERAIGEVLDAEIGDDAVALRQLLRDALDR